LASPSTPASLTDTRSIAWVMNGTRRKERDTRVMSSVLVKFDVERELVIIVSEY